MDTDEDLLVTLQVNLRNALSTFGSSSKQYRDIKQVVEEHIADMKRKEPSSAPEQHIMPASSVQPKVLSQGAPAKLVFRPKT